LKAESTAAEQRIRQLEEGFAKHLEVARSRFECTLVEEFLYWPRQDDVRSAICVPLIAERQHFNIQISPLSIYQVERARGLEFIEPMVAEMGVPDDDPRLEHFFHEGRPHGGDGAATTS
jgi:hypothetical protein